MSFLSGNSVLGTEEFAILVALFLVSTLYSSVGHGGASGYLAVLSLTSYGSLESVWLKQHAWSLNLVVASIAFFHYYRGGYHDFRLSWPFIITSIPMAIVGGYLAVDGVFYDTLLSIALILAAIRLLQIKDVDGPITITRPSVQTALPIGGSIGLFSGMVGVGGGVFLSPIIMLKNWANPKTAAATAALFIWLNSAAGLFGVAASKRLDLDLSVLGPFVIAVLLGGFIGSRFGSMIASQITVRRLLVVVLIVAAAKRIFEAFGL